jgi:hypothetical protein
MCTKTTFFGYFCGIYDPWKDSYARRTIKFFFKFSASEYADSGHCLSAQPYIVTGIQHIQKI